MKPVNEHLSASARPIAMAGMNTLRPFLIPVGQVIYRFYDTKRALTPDVGARGAWWLEYEHFQAIKHFGASHGYSLSYSARLFAAILYEWSEVDAFVACRVTSPLFAWKGRGKQVESTGKDGRDLAKMTP